MQRIIFESAPELILVCVLAGLLYSAVQYYKTKNPWSKNINRALFALRFLLVTTLGFLLLGPIVKQIRNLFEKPLYVIVHDHSASIAQTVDTTQRLGVNRKLIELTQQLEDQGYETSIQNLSGEDVTELSYAATSSDINGSLKRISNRYEGKNVAGVVLVSDGLYNSGVSPLYTSFKFPVYAVGVGDTSERLDITIKNVAYNKIAYQGNRFPIRAEVQLKNLPAQNITASLIKRGKVIDKQTKSSGNNQLLVFDFQPEADQQGIQKYDIEIQTHPNEYNTRNNHASIFVDVVEGKKKILLIASAPHPDIKALRSVIEKNSNYEFLLHIPGISEQQASTLRPEQIDLAILHQSPDLRGKTATLFQSFAKSKTSLLFILGQQSDLPLITRQDMPIKFENAPRDYDEVTPLINPGFSNFNLSPETNALISQFPPVSVHYGKTQIPLSATSLLHQRVGSVATEKPLLAIDLKDGRKIGFLLGEGIWRWRLNEFDRTENTAAFDEVFGKLFQFLSTSDDKRRFRSYPIQQEFSDTEPVVFESQVYNDIFESVYGNTIEIEITKENGSKTDYTYVTSPGNIRYQIGGLKEGVYRYRSRTEINGKMEEVHGEFAIVERQTELQTLTADFDLLRRLAANTGGKFYTANNIDKLAQQLQTREARTIIHSEESYDSVINLKWVFFLLLIMISTEWTLRKYHGSY